MPAEEGRADLVFEDDDASPTGPRKRPKAGLCTETREANPIGAPRRAGEFQSSNGMAYGGKATQKKKRADVAKQAPVIPTPSTPCMPTLHR